MQSAAAHDVATSYAVWLSRPPEVVADDLERYAALLTKWQRVQNLVSRETLPELWTRHFADSLQVLKHLPANAARMVDIGSGGGLPAIPLAIASIGTGRRLELFEPNQRKVSFLRTVARELSLPVIVHGERAGETPEARPADVITARAVAALPALLALAAPRFDPATRALLHKGREHVDELAQASHAFAFDVLVHPSDTDAEGVILEITNLRALSKS